MAGAYAEMDWPENAPDICPSALMLMSSRVEPVDGGEPHRRWHITGVHVATDDDPQTDPAMLGELSVSSGNWRVRVSCLATFGTRGAVREKWLTDHDADDFAQTYGAWASHMMYDFLATQAQSLIGPTWADIDIARLTPPMELQGQGDSAPAPAATVRRRRSKVSSRPAKKAP